MKQPTKSGLRAIISASEGTVRHFEKSLLKEIRRPLTSDSTTDQYLFAVLMEKQLRALLEPWLQRLRAHGFSGVF